MTKLDLLIHELADALENTELDRHEANVIVDLLSAIIRIENDAAV